MLLIVTNKSDLSCDFFILRLKEKGVSFQRLNTEDYREKFHINIHSDKSCLFYSITFANGISLNEGNITAVYFRQPIVPDMSSFVLPEDLDFAQREVTELLRSLWRMIDEEKWLNHPKKLWLSSNKIEQLMVAKHLGFKIPRTCVTVDRNVIKTFIETNHGQVICKAIKHGFIHEDKIVRTATTQRIGIAYLNEISNYAALPMIYQEEIKKAFDIRVTVVDENVFATAIHSQEFPETTVDWRVWDLCDFDLKHEAIVLPERISSLCRQITRHYGLKFAAIDLIQSNQGEYFFLELNPNGQWAWIEKRVGYPLRDKIIACLGL